MNFISYPSYNDVNNQLKKITDIKSSNNKNLNITLAGNVEMNFLKSACFLTLYKHGYSSNISVLPFDSWIPVALKDNESDFWVIWLSSYGLSNGKTKRASLDFKNIKKSINSLKRKGIIIILIIPEAMDVEADSYSDFYYWRNNIINEIKKSLKQKVFLFSLDNIQRTIGMEKWVDNRFWSIAKLPCHPDAATAVSIEVSNVIHNILNQNIRAVVVDLDNTLWGGILGDVGQANLQLDVNSMGRPYLEMQLFIKDLIRKGIPVSIVSKNELETAKLPFLKNKNMILKLRDFLYFEASWEPKYLAIKKIIKGLNLSPDQVCFIDDSLFERDQASQAIPKLRVPDLNNDPEYRINDLIKTGWFSFPVIRKVDKSRVKKYKEEKIRQDARSSFSESDYLKSLKIEIVGKKINAHNIERSYSLIQKTNQFNLTNVKFTKKELTTFIENKNNYAYAFEAKDKFGNYGQISVILIKKTNLNCSIENWVLSCRVFNRGIDLAIYNFLLNWTKKNKINEISCKYVTTKKNEFLLNFMESLGFIKQSEKNNNVCLTCLNPILPKHYVSIKTNIVSI